MADSPVVWTIGRILEWTKQYFKTKGVDNPRLDAEVLLSHILSVDRLYLYVNFERPLSPSELNAYREHVKKRAMRIPVAYITGERDFYGLTFAVNSSVLVPRPETELLVEAAIKRLGDKPATILDLGTGSGAIPISVLSCLPHADGLAVDISADALAVAKQNSAKHLSDGRLEFRLGDLWQPVEGLKFDAILSNPPYIPAQDLTELAPEVLYEPMLALAGGEDGLDFYRRLLKRGAEFLNSDGFMALEVGINQAKLFSELASGTGLTVDQIIRDYAGIERVVVLCREEKA